MPFFLNGVFLIPTAIILKGLWVKDVGALGGYLIGQVCVASTELWVSSECTFPCEAPAQAASHQVRQRCCWLIPVKSQRNAAAKGRDLSSTYAVIPDRVLQIHFSNLPFSVSHLLHRHKLRWHSFQSSHRPSLSSASLQINCQSVAQMNLLQKYSLLKLTALLEKYTPSNKHGFSW